LFLRKKIRTNRRCVTGFATIVALLASHASAQSLGSLDCVIEPHEIVDVASRVDGIVDVLAVERGDMVAAGQVLAKLDSGVEQAAVATARLRAKASAEVNANNISVDFAKRRRDRLGTLYKDSVISGDQMDEVETEAVLSWLARSKFWTGIRSLARSTAWSCNATCLPASPPKIRQLCVSPR